jgi:hypothetical protein
MKSLSVVCPVCGAKQEFEIPVKLIVENIKGVSTIAVNAQCGHGYHIFVDRNFSIRGYQRSDFDIAATVEKEAPIQDLSLPGIVRMFGEDAFAYATHALLLNKKAILVGTDQQILKTLFVNFIALFEKELADSASAIEIMSKEEYNQIDPLNLSGNLIIDLDFSVIKNNPFFADKVKNEKDLLKESLAIKNIEVQKIDFKDKIRDIFLYVNIILNFIYQGQIVFKDIKKVMKEKKKDINEKELELAWAIAQGRYAGLLK